jgi:hypothetical protein
MKKPKFFVHDVAEIHKNKPSSRWLRVHNQIVDAISAVGCALDIVTPGCAPPEPLNGIFIGKHSRLTIDNCWNVKMSYLLDYFYFDRTGYSGWAEMANDPKCFERAMAVSQIKADEFFGKLYAETVLTNHSKHPQGNTPFLPPVRSFVFLPLQLSFDTVMQLSRIDHFVFYEAVRDWSLARNLDLVIKPHPAAQGIPAFGGRKCQSTQAILCDSTQHAHVHSTNASIHSILPLCDAIFCINSGVGFESLIHHKPVITAGHVDYHWATRCVGSIDDVNAIDDWIVPLLGQDDLRKFLYYFLNDYLSDSRDESNILRCVNHALGEYSCRDTDTI